MDEREPRQVMPKGEVLEPMQEWLRKDGMGPTLMKSQAGSEGPRSDMPDTRRDRSSQEGPCGGRGEPSCRESSTKSEGSGQVKPKAGGKGPA